MVAFFVICAGTMDHLTCMLKDMRDSIERLGMQCKEKRLAIVAGPYTDYKAGDTVEITSNKGRRWVWRVVDGLEALGSWLGVRGCSEAGLWHRIAKSQFPVLRKEILAVRSQGSGQEAQACLPLHVCGCCTARCWRMGMYAVHVSRVAYLGAGQTQTRFYGCARGQTRLGVDCMKRTRPVVARQLKKHAQPNACDAACSFSRLPV